MTTNAGRFLLFAGDIYYPCGGWEDFVGAFATLEDAKNACEGSKYGWAHVVDADTATIVANREDSDPWEDGARYA